MYSQENPGCGGKFWNSVHIKKQYSNDKAKQDQRGGTSILGFL